MTKPAAARATGRRSFSGGGGDGRRAFRGAARELAAEDHEGLVLPGGEFLFGGQISRRSWQPFCRLPLSFARRRLFAVLRGTLPEAGHLHLRRTGSRAVARAPNGIFEADAADGAVHDLPGHHGHAFTDADGLSQCATAAAVEIWPGAGDRRTD